MIGLLFLVAQTVPVTATTPGTVDHTFTCTIFNADGQKQELTGSAHVQKRMAWAGQLTLASSDGSFPVGSFKASVNGPNSLAVKAKQGGEEFTYMFERTSNMDARPGNGTIIVSKQKWPAAFSYVGTGICSFMSKATQ